MLWEKACSRNPIASTMLLPAAIALSSHIAGALLGLGGRYRALSALRTFALVSALAIVLSQLLPEALGGAGLWALPIFALASALPTLLTKLSLKVGRASDSLGLELGYAGLLIHKVADGVGLATFSGPAHEGHSHGDVLFALSAHTIPVVALVALAYQARSGWRVAALRVAGLLAATLFGVLATGLVPADAFARIEPWVTAAVGGLLLHVVVHDWKVETGPRGAREQLVDLVAVMAGIGLVMAGGHHHDHEGTDLRADVASALWELSLETAPALLFGLVVGALIAAWSSGRLPARWLGGGPLRQAIVGASIGAPIPICACGVLPLADTLRRRGAGPALVVAFLLAAPELGVETFALTGRMLGWPFALLRLGAALTLATIAALAVHRSAPRHAHIPVRDDTSATAAPFAKRAIASFDELVQHIAPWTVVGLIAAAFVQATLGDRSLAGLRPFGLDVVIVTLLAVPSYVCAASATPLAAVLLAKGMSPGAVLVGLLLGPATNLATVGFLRKSYGGRAALFGFVALVLASWVIAFAVHASGWVVVPSVEAEREHAHSILTWVAAAVLSIALLRSVARAGVRGWIASLGESLGTAPHDHDHGCSDGCGHDHDHHAHACDDGCSAHVHAHEEPDPHFCGEGCDVLHALDGAHDHDHHDHDKHEHGDDHAHGDDHGHHAHRDDHAHDHAHGDDHAHDHRSHGHGAEDHRHPHRDGAR